MSQLRLGACVVYEGDHASRTSGKNSTYEVSLRNSATGVPVMTVAARNVADKASAISCPLHTSDGADCTVNFNCTPQESIKETFDTLCKPILHAVATGEEPLSTIVIDSAGAPRNRIATSLLDMILSYFASGMGNNNNSNKNSSPQHDAKNHYYSPRMTNSNVIERAHASLVELDTRGELVDVLDPTSPHNPRIDENFDAQSVHVSNATLLDIVPRTNRAKISRSVIAGKHAVCTIFLRRKSDGSLGSVTVILLQAFGDGLKTSSSSSNNNNSSSSNNKNSFRSILQQVCDGLTSDPIPPTVPFSKSYLTFLLKGTLCQTHPSAWIVALSPWYENADEKETFADAVIVMKSARVVAGLTDLSTRSLTSVSPQRNNNFKKANASKSSPPKQKIASTGNSNANFMTTMPAFYDNVAPNVAADNQQNTSTASLSPPTPSQLQQNPNNNNNINSRFLSHYSNAIITSNPNSPAPKEQNSAAAPQPIPLAVLIGNNNHNNNNNVTAATQLVQQVRQLEQLASTLQSSLKKTQDENQQLKMQVMTLGSQLGDAETKANRCESIVSALQQSGKFALASNYHQQQKLQPATSNNNNNINNTKETSAARRLRQQLISPAIELPSSANNVGVSLLQNHQNHSATGTVTPQQMQLQDLAPTARSRSGSQQSNQPQPLQYNNNNNNYINETSLVSTSSALNNNNNNDHLKFIPSDVWSRNRSGRNNNIEPQANINQNRNNIRNTQQQEQQQQHRRSVSTDSNYLVVGYNFDLTEDEERAVRREMEKRGIIKV